MSIFGSFDRQTITDSRASATARPTYGSWTACASCACRAAGVIFASSAADSPATARMTGPMKVGNAQVASELNAWVSVSRDEAVSGRPSTATNGFAATCRMTMPVASTKNAVRNRPYDRAAAAG